MSDLTQFTELQTLIDQFFGIENDGTKETADKLQTIGNELYDQFVKTLSPYGILILRDGSAMLLESPKTVIPNKEPDRWKWITTGTCTPITEI